MPNFSKCTFYKMIESSNTKYKQPVEKKHFEFFTNFTIFTETFQNLIFHTNLFQTTKKKSSKIDPTVLK